MLSAPALVMNMKATTAFAIALAFAGTVAAAPFTVRVGEVSLAFDPGSDYCALDEAAHDADRLVINQQRHANRDSNELLAMLAPCMRLEAFREGVPMTHYGILLSTYVKGRIQPIPGMERARFLEIMNERWQRDPSLDIVDAHR